MSERVQLLNGDCLDLMKQIPDGSVDMVLCDLPYGTTDCKWDVIIPFEILWEQYKRIRKPYAPILLFGSEPFSTLLRSSNLDEFRYDWIWIKSQAADFVHAKNRPMKNYEIISAFCKLPMGHVSQLGEKRMPYNPQGLIPCRKIKSGDKKFGTHIGQRPSHKDKYISEFTNYPTAVLSFPQIGKKYHPTQKPVALLEYLIKTYTNEGELVLDNCMGSGSTGVACLNTNRRFIGIEKNEKYFAIAKERIEKTMSTPKQGELL